MILRAYILGGMACAFYLLCDPDWIETMEDSADIQSRPFRRLLLFCTIGASVFWFIVVPMILWDEYQIWKGPSDGKDQG